MALGYTSESFESFAPTDSCDQDLTTDMVLLALDRERWLTKKAIWEIVAKRFELSQNLFQRKLTHLTRMLVALIQADQVEGQYDPDGFREYRLRKTQGR